MSDCKNNGKYIQHIPSTYSLCRTTYRLYILVFTLTKSSGLLVCSEQVEELTDTLVQGEMY